MKRHKNADLERAAKASYAAAEAFSEMYKALVRGSISELCERCRHSLESEELKRTQDLMTEARREIRYTLGLDSESVCNEADRTLFDRFD